MFAVPVVDVAAVTLVQRFPTILVCSATHALEPRSRALSYFYRDNVTKILFRLLSVSSFAYFARKFGGIIRVPVVHFVEKGMECAPTLVDFVSARLKRKKYTKQQLL